MGNAKAISDTFTLLRAEIDNVPGTGYPRFNRLVEELKEEIENLVLVEQPVQIPDASPNPYDKVIEVTQNLLGVLYQCGLGRLSDTEIQPALNEVVKAYRSILEGIPRG